METYLDFPIAIEPLGFMAIIVMSIFLIQLSASLFFLFKRLQRFLYPSFLIFVSVFFHQPKEPRLNNNPDKEQVNEAADEE